MSALRRHFELFARFLDWSVTALLAALLVEVLLIILARQIGLSWVWLYDVTRWTLAWAVYSGAVALTYRSAHLAIDIAAKALPGWATSISRVSVIVCTVMICAIIAYFGGTETFRMFEAGERSMSGALPAFIGYAVMPLAFSLIALAALASSPPPPSDYNQ